MSIAVCDQSKPLSSIVLFAVDDDFTIYFASLRDSFKARTLQKNNKISLCVWQTKQMLVQADGEVSLLQKKKEAGEALEKIVQSATSLEDFWPPILQIKGHDYQVFKVHLTWMRALDLTSAHISETESMFTDFFL